VKGTSPTNKGTKGNKGNKGTKGTKGFKGTKGVKGNKGVNNKNKGNNHKTQVCSKRCLMPKNSRRNRMMPPVARSAAANPDIATLAKTADLGAALKWAKRTPACQATFSRRTPFASTHVCAFEIMSTVRHM
jgi:hypothetical protein